MQGKCEKAGASYWHYSNMGPTYGENFSGELADELTRIESAPNIFHVEDVTVASFQDPKLSGEVWKYVRSSRWIAPVKHSTQLIIHIDVSRPLGSR